MPLAAPRAGLVHVPINPLLKRGQVAHILADSGAAMLLTQAARAATLEAGDVPQGVPVMTEAGRAMPYPGRRPIPMRWRRSSTPPARRGGPRGDAEPCQSLVRRGIGRPLPEAGPMTGCWACCPSASIMARTSCFRPGSPGRGRAARLSDPARRGEGCCAPRCDDAGGGAAALDAVAGYRLAAGGRRLDPAADQFGGALTPRLVRGCGRCSRRRTSMRCTA